MMSIGKRMICLILMSSLLLSALCFSVGALSFIRGDADADGTVSVIDATTIQKAKASVQVDAFDEKAADVDGDGVVSVIDATLIQKSLAHIDIPYEVGETVTVETDAPTQTIEHQPGENELPILS